MKQLEIPFMQLRGGSSKGLYFLASDLPSEADVRNAILVDAVGRGSRQIDGLGGADPLTSKVAIVGPSTRADADIDFHICGAAGGGARGHGAQEATCVDNGCRHGARPETADCPRPGV